MQEGLPCQTLISSILHKYINGRFIEKTFYTVSRLRGAKQDLTP